MAKHKGVPKKTTFGDDAPTLVIEEPSSSLAIRSKGKEVSAPEIRKSVSEGAQPLSPVIRQEHEYERDVPSVATQDPDLPKARSAQNSQYIRMSGRDERLFFEDILRFEDLAVNPSCTIGKLSLARVELNSIVIRERLQANALEAFTMDRSGVMKEFSDRLEERIRSMGGKLHDLQPVPSPYKYDTSDESDGEQKSTIEKGRTAGEGTGRG